MRPFICGHSSPQPKAESGPAFHNWRLLYSPACLLLRKNCFSSMRWPTFTALFLRPCRRGLLVPAEFPPRSEEHTSELQSRGHLVCRLLLEKKKKIKCTSRSSITHPKSTRAD